MNNIKLSKFEHYSQGSQLTGGPGFSVSPSVTKLLEPNYKNWDCGSESALPTKLFTGDLYSKYLSFLLHTFPHRHKAAPVD